MKGGAELDEGAETTFVANVALTTLITNKWNRVTFGNLHVKLNDIMALSCWLLFSDVTRPRGAREDNNCRFAVFNSAQEATPLKF